MIIVGNRPPGSKTGCGGGISHNLPASVEKADVVILALPAGEIHETPAALPGSAGDAVLLIPHRLFSHCRG
jgi:predicted dinucleotide-binding enzyme